jgi:hypothetical protein
MNVKWDTPLRPDQLPNPVVHSELLAPGASWANVTDEELLAVFPMSGQSLKTWGDGLKAVHEEPHWIGVRKQTPLHTDPKYPRYTHHLILRVDRFVLRGVNREEVPIHRGTYLVLDTHSPHQLFATERGALWYVAVSLDSKTILPRDETVARLSAFASTASFLNSHIVKPNNGGRFSS